MTGLSLITDSSVRAGPRPDLGAVVSQLEQSLRAGQGALLLRDVEKFAEQTAIQVSLSKVLADCLRNSVDCDDKLRGACFRVMHLCRVQSSLLRRAQRTLQVLSNLLAGPGSNYADLARLQRPAIVTNGASQQEI